jgi:hypothetical protein
MWSHLSDEQLMNVLDGVGTPKAEAHVAECAHCQALLRDARATLGIVETSDAVPEPGDAYWANFSRELKGGLRKDTRRPVFRFSLGPSLAAAAVLVAAIGLFELPNGRAPVASPAAPTLAPWTALPSDEDDSGIALIQAMVPSPDEIAPAAGCESVTSCVVDRLSEEESHAFLDRMRSERGGSL